MIIHFFPRRRLDRTKRREDSVESTTSRSTTATGHSSRDKSSSVQYRYELFVHLSFTIIPLSHFIMPFHSDTSSLMSHRFSMVSIGSNVSSDVSFGNASAVSGMGFPILITSILQFRWVAQLDFAPKSQCRVAHFLAD